MTRLSTALAFLPLTACIRIAVEDDAVPLDGPVTAVDIDIDSGDVVLEASDDADIRVERHVEHLVGNVVTIEAEVVDGTLRVFGRCGAGALFCTLDHHVFVPRDVAADLLLGSGDVDVSGSNGPLVANTGSGDVDAHDVAGPVDLSTGSGDVTGTGLGGDVTVSSGSGDVDLTLVDALVLLDATTGSGDLTLTVPSGAYALDLDTGSGDLSTTGVTDDPAGSPLRAHSGSGDIDVSGR